MAKIELEWGCLKVSVGAITVGGKTASCLFAPCPWKSVLQGEGLPAEKACSRYSFLICDKRIREAFCPRSSQV